MAVAESRSTAELVMDVADDLRMLVRKEIELARIELMEGLKAQLVGAGLITLAAISVLPALLFGLFALVYWLPFSIEVSYAIVAGGMLLGALALIGIGVKVMKSRRPKLDSTVASIKEDVRWAREQLTS
jgi:uncharacterized membrane protein YqjE